MCTSACRRRRQNLLFLLAALLAGVLPSTATQVAAASPAKPVASVELARLEERLAANPSLADLLAYARIASPMIAAAREGWKAAVERRRVTGAYPDPELTAVFWPMKVPGDLGMRRFEVMASQTVPWPGMLAAAGKVVEKEALAARVELDRAYRDVTVQVRESYHELLYLAEARRIAAQNAELLDHLRRVGETAYPSDRATLFDVLKAQSQAGQVMYDVVLVEELERSERARLNALLNRPAEAPLGPLVVEHAPALARSLEEVRSLAEANRDEVRLAVAEEEKMRAEAAMADYLNRPEFMLGLQYDYDAPEDADAESMLGLQFGFSLPLWGAKRAGRRGEAAALVARARAMTGAQVNEARAMVAESWFRLRNAERLVTLYRDELLPQAGRAVENAETWYREGRGSFTDLVETQALWYNFQLALARARADQGRYLARLERLAGRPLTGAAGATVPAPEVKP